MPIRNFVLMMGLMGLSCGVAVAEDSAVALPPVPASVLKTGSAPEPTTGGGITPQTIKVSSGINEIVTVAQNHLNRIVTPFPSPRVRTVSRAETQVEGNVVYVASNSEEPVTLYITPGENEALAISLTLAPKLIPPREIRLELAGVEYSRLTQSQPASKKAGDSDDTVQQEHIAQIKATLRELALMQSPIGFSGRPVTANETVYCDQAGIQTTVGQAFDGRHTTILIAKTVNTTPQRVELDERACVGQGAGVSDVVAVAAWPEVWLEPGQSTELFVVMKQRGITDEQIRPSLLH